MSSPNLRIGVPSKGRLHDLAVNLLAEAGLHFRQSSRSLFARARGMDVDVTFLRTDDIPVLCAVGAIDLGITGGDLVAESGADVDVRKELGVGACRLAVCVPDSADVASPADLVGARVATSFPRLTSEFFTQHGVEAQTVTLSGSVEVMIALGVADAIVDLVETGSTLAANGLRLLADIGNYQTLLIQNRQRRHADLADRLVRRIEGVVIARSYSLLEYNIPRENLAAAEKITPGFNSPTVSALEDGSWCAVQVMVPRNQVIDVMDRLEAIGASAILETAIANCRL
ncbi:MAG: ATP phosphoribosyltransferase [Planctomycetales bacterium]|nr:ATP phosphoribosyltransferase [Planctomycetales bacterium]